MTNEDGGSKVKSTIKQEEGLLGLKEVSQIVTSKNQRIESSKRNRRQNVRRKVSIKGDRRHE